MLGINSTQISALKTNSGSTHQNFESDSHGVSHRGPPWEVSKELNENKACWVSILLRFQLLKRIQGQHAKISNQTPMGWPIGVPLGRSPKNLMEKRHVGYQFYSDFSTENVESDSHGKLKLFSY